MKKTESKEIETKVEERILYCNYCKRKRKHNLVIELEAQLDKDRNQRYFPYTRICQTCGEKTGGQKWIWGEPMEDRK